MVKVPENGQESGQEQVCAKPRLAVLRSRFAKRGVQDFLKLGLDCVPMHFLANEGFGDVA